MRGSGRIKTYLLKYRDTWIAAAVLANSLLVFFALLCCMSGNMNTLRILLAFILAFNLVCALTVFMIRRFTVRVAEIMNVFMNDDFHLQWLDVDNKTFAKMLQELEELMKNLTDREYNQELLLIQARMSALQNQINPHFLYNTLDVIRSYALMQDCREVAEMTEALSTMFRYNIGKPNEMATVEEELDNVKNYFLIQQYRFGDKFQLHIEWEDREEDLTQYILPRLSLQPLVENAIHHGLESKMGQGDISIYVFRTEKELGIRVRDNGKGMSRGTLMELRERMDMGTAMYIEPRKKGKSGIAIVNLNQRLKLSFGEEYGVQVSSIENVGTFFMLTLPLYTQREWQNRNEAIQ